MVSFEQVAELHDFTHTFKKFSMSNHEKNPQIIEDQTFGCLTSEFIEIHKLKSEIKH